MSLHVTVATKTVLSALAAAWPLRDTPGASDIPAVVAPGDPGVKDDEGVCCQDDLT